MTTSPHVELGTVAVPRMPHRVLHYLMANRSVTDTELAKRLGLTRQTIYNRRTGRSMMSAADIFDMAAALEVEPGLFMRSPADAVEWLLMHDREQFVCTNSHSA
jgi:transcriptional regulator with XRE-family HTH domain